MGFSVTWTPGRLIKAVSDESDDNLKEVAEYIAGRMSARVEKDTGTLEGSIEVRKINPINKDIVGYNIGAQMSGNYTRFYASFHELGTSTTGAQPFMRPALYHDGAGKLKGKFK